MKIINSRKEKRVAFGEIATGECFLDDEELIIKIKGKNFCNAVSLQTGEIYLFDNEYEVQPVKAGVTIYE